MSAANFVASFTTLIGKLVERAKKAGSASIYTGTGSLASLTNKTIDLVPLLPAGQTLDNSYIQTCIVDIKVKDTDSGSAFNGMAVDGSAVIAYGISDAGVLTIRNFDANAVTYWVRVMGPASK